MAISFALAGLKVLGITILDPDCVAKTYPEFWDDLRARRQGGGCQERDLNQRKNPGHGEHGLGDELSR
jgi:hypothetical protein